MGRLPIPVRSASGNDRYTERKHVMNKENCGTQRATCDSKDHDSSHWPTKPNEDTVQSQTTSDRYEEDGFVIYWGDAGEPASSSESKPEPLRFERLDLEKLINEFKAGRGTTED